MKINDEANDEQQAHHEQSDSSGQESPYDEHSGPSTLNEQPENARKESLNNV